MEEFSQPFFLILFGQRAKMVLSLLRNVFIDSIDDPLKDFLSLLVPFFITHVVLVFSFRKVCVIGPDIVGDKVLESEELAEDLVKVVKFFTAVLFPGVRVIVVSWCLEVLIIFLMIL